MVDRGRRERRSCLVGVLSLLGLLWTWANTVSVIFVIAVRMLDLRTSAYASSVSGMQRKVEWTCVCRVS